jgi:hypothetical protein
MEIVTMSKPPIRSRLAVAATLLVSLLWLAACGREPAPAPVPAPTAEPTPGAPTDEAILALPSAFRYEVTVRRPGTQDEPATVIAGQYRDGAWSQSAARGEDPSEDLVVAPEGSGGPLHSYTRPAGDATWTRWPGPGFDAGYGLASPFSILRLYPLADQRAGVGSEAVAGAPEATTKEQVVFSAEIVQRLLSAGVSAVAQGAEERAALEEQLAPLVSPQTVTYWVGESYRVYRAAATLLTADQAGGPAPWLEVIWRFWGYDDPGIAVAAPATYIDADVAAPPSQPAAAASAEPVLDPKTNLRVRSFALPGQPLERATVTVFSASPQARKAGTQSERKAVAALNAADAQFSLAPGTYDVQVQAGGAEEWLKEVRVIAESLVSQDVVFDFGTLALTVTQNGTTPKVDIVIYPAGQRQTFVDWRSENPTAVRLAAGAYDVEVALPDYTGTKAFKGIEVQAGQTATQTLDIGK